MRTLYIDCTGGASGDMILKALEDLAHEAEHHHDHHHDHHHGRSYEDVKKIIETARQTALEIYGVVARAEARVHEMTLETVHFHEVGRDEAIKNAMGIGMALAKLGFGAGNEDTGNSILVSSIYDGTGFVDCAHGRIPVPVPAVRAMMDECEAGTGPGKGFEFRTAEEVETEMVTPSGLAALMGIGARPAPEGFAIMGSIIAQTEVTGTRDTGRGGLRAFLIEG